MKGAVVMTLSLLLAGGAGYWILSADGQDDTAKVSSETVGERDKKRARRSSASNASRERFDRDVPVDEGLEARVARLEKRVRTLEGQLRVSEGRARGQAPSALDLDDPESSAQLHEVVEDALADAREEERARRDEQRREFMNARREEALAALVQGAGLAAEKAGEVSSLWESEQEQISDLFNQARNGELDFRAAREQAEAIRSATDAAATAEMSEEQKTAYDENRPGPPRRGPGRGGRG